MKSIETKLGGELNMAMCNSPRMIYLEVFIKFSIFALKSC